MVLASLLLQGVGYIFLWVVFRQLPVVAGWTLPEVVIVYAMIYVTEGCVAFFCEGFWGLSWIRHRGDFDAILLRPVPAIIQVAVSTVGLNWIFGILLGLVMISRSIDQLAIDWTPARIVGALVLFVSAALLRASTVIISASIGLWIESPFNPFLMTVHSFSNFARFPLTIYGRWLNLTLTFLVPFGFVSYYPVCWLLGKAPFAWAGLLTPAVALLFFATGVFLFHRGLRQYEGSGN
jgi:ABC-2 type transport system permease protein